MYQIKLNKNQKSISLKKVERSVKLSQKVLAIKLQQTGRRGPPGEDKNFVQNFINSAEVTVIHNLNKIPAVTVNDTTEEEVVGQVEHISINQLIVRFSSSFSGTVVCN